MVTSHSEKQPKIGDYVEVYEEPEGYPYVARGTLGRVVGDEWLENQGILNVDVLDSRSGEVVNLTFYPRQLRVRDERILQRMPNTTWFTQYGKLKSYREANR